VRRPWAVGTVLFLGLSIATLIYQGYRSPWAPVLHAEIPAAVTAGLQGDAARGAQLFKDEACLACHSMGGQGGGRGPDLSSVGDRLSKDQLTWRIAYGGNNMPAYGQTLKPDELNALVEFLSQRHAQ
jgi:ubiquinol-cytochrome c reductase cytochrome b subunit